MSASTASLATGHERLQALVGAWQGEEEMSATQWAPAGLATAELVTEPDCGGLYIVQRYRQARDGKPSFASHNVFAFDRTDGSYKLYQFDSMGFMPVPASGAWTGDELVMVRTSERGSARVSYFFDSQDSYRTRLEFRPAGAADWQDMAKGTFRRVSPSSLTIS